MRGKGLTQRKGGGWERKRGGVLEIGAEKLKS